MKKILYLLALAVLFALHGPLQAQTLAYRLASIDNGTSYSVGYYAPFYCNATAAYNQMIYTSNEIGGPGYIDTLWFQCQTSNAMTDNITLKLGHTALTHASTTSQWVPDSALTTVYNDVLTHGDATGWIPIVMETPFYYNGYENLVVVIGQTRSAAVASANAPKYYYSSGTSGVTLYRTGSSTFPTTTGTRSTYHPNMRLSMRAPSFSCASPELTLANLLDNRVIIRWPAVSGVSQYQVDYGVQGHAPGSGTTLTVSDTSVTITGLSPSTDYDIFVRSLCSDNSYSAYSLVRFTTPCSPIAHSSLPYIEDFNSYLSGSANPIGSCWHKGTNSTTAYPYPSGSYYCGNSGIGLYFYATTTYYSYAALPLFADSLQQLQLSFDARRSMTSSSHSGIIKVGVMSNPNDINTFEEITTINLPTGTDCNNYSVAFTNYSGSGRYMAILNDNDGTNYFAIDNVTVEALPDCMSPQNLVVAPGDVSATLTWESANTASSYSITYAPTLGGSSTTVTGTGDTAVLTGLTPNTEYSLILSLLCGSDHSDTVTATFTTQCAAIATLPYSYGFEDATGSGSIYEINNCWGRFREGTTTAYPYPSSTYTHSGRFALYFYNNATTAATRYYCWTSMPLITAPLNTLQLEFWGYKTSASYGHITVGVMTDPSDITTFDTVADLQVENISTWEHFELPLSGYTGTGRFVAFLSKADVLNYIYLDDISIDLLPTCPRPTRIDTVNVTTSTATLLWHESGTATSYRVSYAANGNTAISLEVHDTTVSLTGLIPGTRYEVEIRALCSSTDSSSLATMVFYTQCAPIPHDQLPYLEDFDNYTSGSTSTIHPCWYKGTASTSTQYPYPNSTYHYGESGNGLYFYTTSTYNYCYAALPEFEDSLVTLELTLMARRVTSTYSGPLIVGVMSDPTNHSSFEEVGRVYLPNDILWREYSFTFADYSGTGTHIAICTDTNYYNTIAIDNVSVRTYSNCPTPAEPIITAMDNENVTFVWPADPLALTTGYEYEYGPADFVLGTGTLQSTTDTSATLTGLAAGTTYDFYLYGICGTTYSNYRKVSFTTACAPIASEDLPLFEDFDSYSSGSNAEIDSCWYRGTNSTSHYPYPYSTYSCGGTGNGLYFYSTTSYYSYIVLPLFEDSLSTLELNFDARRTNTSTTYTGRVIVGIMVNPTDKNTLVAVDTINLPTSIAECSNYTVNFENYTGSGRYITILNDNSGTNYFIVDNLSVGIRSDCARPADYDHGTITENSVALHWSPDSTHDASTVWTVEYDTTGFNIGEGTVLSVTDTFITITGLTPSTTYDFYLNAECGASSSATMLQTLTTACSPVPSDSLPYIETFDSYLSGANHPFNNCWYRYYGYNGSTTNYPYPYASYHHGATGNSLYFYSSTTTNYYCYAVLPRFEENVQNLVLSFWGYKTSANYGNLKIGVMTDPTDISTFTLVQSIQVEQLATWEQFDIYFNNYADSGQYITLYSPEGALNYIYVDDVTVNRLPSCPQPTLPIVLNCLDVDSTVVNWTQPMGTPADWSLAYHNSMLPFDSATVISHIDTTVYTLHNLAAGTAYNVYVRANCTDETSEWRGPVRFTAGTFEMPITGTEAFVTCSGTLYDNGGASGIYGNSCNSIVTIYPKSDSLVSITGMVNTYDSLDYIRIFDGPGVTSTQLAKLYGYDTSVSVTSTEGPLTLQFVTNATANTSAAGFALQVHCVAAPSCPSIVDLDVESAARVAALTWSYLGADSIVPTVQLRLSDATGIVDSGSTTSQHYFFSGLTPNHVYTVALRTVCDTFATNWQTITFTTPDSTSGCTPPLVVVSQVTENSIALSWAPTGSETSWDVQYHTLANPVWHTLINMTNTRSETFTGLLPSTVYFFRVIANCTDTTAYTEVQTQTLCAPITSLPWSENFDSWTAGSSADLAACWHRYSTFTTTVLYPYVTSSTYATSTPNAVYLYGSTTGFSGLVTPAFASALNQLEVTFSLRKTSANYRIMVGCMEDPEDYSTFVPIDTVSPATTTASENFIVPLTGYTGTGSHIAFFTPQGLTTYMYLDNLTVDIYHSCPRVDSISIDSVTANSMTLSWNGTAPNYMIEYGPQGFALGSGRQIYVASSAIAPSTRNHYTITGLHTAQDYDFYIRSHCTGDYSGWSFPISGSTSCGAIDSLPYEQDYEHITASTTTMQVPNCWTPISGYSTLYPQVRSATVNGVATKGAYLYKMIQSKKNMPPDSVATGFSLPAFDPVNYPVNRLQVKFDLTKITSSLSLYRSGVIVGLCTVPGDINTFHAIDTFVATYNRWTSHEVFLDLATVPGNYITFRDYTDFDPNTTVVGNDSTLYNYCYIDNIVVTEVPACAMPVYLTCNHASTYSANVSWTPRAGSTYWQLEYGPQGFYIGNGTRVNVSGSPSYTITGLQPMTYYDYYVRSVCPGDTSEWSAVPCTFATLQVPATLPYYYDFEDPAEWNNWTSVSNNNILFVRGTATADSSEYSIYVSPDSGATIYAAMNAIVNAFAYRDVDFGSTDSSFRISISSKTGGTISHYYDGLVVLVENSQTLVTPQGEGLRSPWGQINSLRPVIGSIRRQNDWLTYEGSIDHIHGVHRVILWWFGQSTGTTDFMGHAAAVDNVRIDYETCPRPLTPQVSTVGINRATLYWDGPESATYRVYYRTVDETNYNYVVANTNYITLRNLDTATTYYWYVRKDCTSELSVASEVSQFTTLYCFGQNVASTGDGSATTTSYQYPFSQSANYNYSQTIILRNELSSAMQGDFNQLRLHYGSDSVMRAKDSVYIYMGHTAKSSFSSTVDRVPFANLSLVYSGPLNCTHPGWNTFYLDSLFHYNGDSNIVVAFVDRSGAHDGTLRKFTYESAGTSNYRMIYKTGTTPINPATLAASTTMTRSINRATMRLVACSQQCNAPQLGRVTTDFDEATVSWLGTNDMALGYEVQIRQLSNPLWTTTYNLAASDSTFRFTGLYPATQYVYRLRSQCTATDFSPWSESTFLTDSLHCYQPDSLTVSDVINNAATFSWSRGADEGAWELHVFNSTYDTLMDLTSRSVRLTGLVTGVTYHAAVRSRCGSGAMSVSEWSDTLTFTTLTCPNVDNLNTSQVTYSSVTLNWAVDPMAESWVIEYGYTGFAQGTGTRVSTDVNSYVVNGLEDETSYDFFVKALCGDDWTSENWTLASATTLTAPDEDYTVTVEVNDASMGTATGGGVYHAGSTATVTATANPGYRFVNWSIGITDNPYSFVVTSDITLTAYFEALQAIDDVSGDIRCTIFPNPAHDATTINVSGANGKVLISVVDMNGRTVASQTQECSSDCVMTMEVADLAQGAYFVRITGDKINVVKKLIIK